MSASDWVHADHELALGRMVQGDSMVVPIWCDGGKIIAQGGELVWCDVRCVSNERPDALVKDAQFEACGVVIGTDTCRRAWADDVAPLDVAEAIWQIGPSEVPKPRRPESSFDSSYWVGLGPCWVCDAGLIAVCLGEDDQLLHVCQSCGLCWLDSFDLAENKALSVVSMGGLEFASADDVAANWLRRWDLALKDRAQNEPTLDLLLRMRSQLWTIRPRSVLD